MNDLEGKVAFVTGGASGIGRACANLIAKRGAAVLIADRDGKGAEQATAEIVANGGQASWVELDVTDPVAVADAVDRAVELFGCLNLAVNNAGVGGVRQETAIHSFEDWDRVLAINLSGVFFCLKYEISAMLSSGGGAIVNMSSIMGTVAFPGAAGYVAAKHGVVGLTKTAALEYGSRNIRVNAVGPGAIHTPIFGWMDQSGLEKVAAVHPMARLGRAEEVAEIVAFLLSDKASFITGSYHLADGGYVAQ